ncbi:class I SAM-dependent methyltransferase [Ferruginibacter sp. SUN002]|uniref:class I SAM-dependent methyltransferase n=1 Tax=Ferruginibacter sp. SUN002 TaxID=2937789 RepID=UPI003D361E0A
MKILTYIHYFFYLGFNWNFRIASHIIIQEIKGEKKYGIKTTGVDNLKKSGVDIFNATIYMPVSYDLLEEIFFSLPSTINRHFLDIGCGKGRVICVASQYKFKKITGIDFSKSLCEDAIENTRLLKKTTSTFDVIATDAANYKIPNDVDCIFLFNPFNELIMNKVVQNIQQSIASNKREVYIVYVNPVLKNSFTKKTFTEVYYSKRLKYLEVCILKNNL